MVIGTALRAIVTCSAVVAITSGVNVQCAAGTRVYSLTVWSGHWLDGLVMRCTGDSDEHVIPPDFNDDPGGEEEEDVCGGTAGVHSIEWGVPEAYYGMVYLNITCSDSETYHFATGLPYAFWNITSSQTVSCEEGEYMQGIAYSVDRPEESNFSYFLTGIDFLCSSSKLDPICKDCLGDTTLKGDEDLPEFCELPSCSQAECCEPTANDSEDITDDIVIGVVTTVIAAMIFSVTAWAYKKFNICKKGERENEGGIENNLRVARI